MSDVRLCPAYYVAYVTGREEGGGSYVNSCIKIFNFTLFYVTHPSRIDDFGVMVAIMDFI